MTSTLAQLAPIECVPGVDTDNTPLATPHFTWSQGIRFVRNMPQKIGGWIRFYFDNDAEVDGYARSIYSANVDGRVRTAIGTNAKLYSVLGQALTNITPLQNTPVAAANSLDTHYATLAADPIHVEDGSNVVTVDDAEADLFRVNDSYTLSGATTTGGITNTLLNDTHVVREVLPGQIQIRVSASATSTTAGGGASVVRTSGLITVNSTAHGNEDGDRVAIDGSVDTGGILAAEINQQFIIRNVQTDSFDVMTIGTASSSVTSGGGAGAEYYEEIPIGDVNESIGQGYGMGLYGVGLYGVSKLSNNVRRFPRIWYFDRFGEYITMTPGNQGGLYRWDSTSSDAPELVPNAPTAINYQFVSDNILVTFGAGGVENKIFSSDQGDMEEWTASSLNQVFEDNIEGAGRLLSHVAINGQNLIFTETQTYVFSYIGLPNVWSIELKEPNIGIIASMARVSINGTAYWMDDANFYMWSGGDIDVIPSNTATQSTIHNWMFGDLNYGQKSKTFAWYNPQFNEIWFHSLSQNENEPDKVARLNIIELTWCPDYIHRTAAEYPNISLANPRLMNVGAMYKHELGYNDDVNPLYFELSTNYRTLGRNFADVSGIIPDSVQTGDISINITQKRFPQSAPNAYFETFTVSPTTERVAWTTNGGYWQYTLSGEQMDQFWRAGSWQEYSQKAGFN